MVGSKARVHEQQTRHTYMRAALRAPSAYIQVSVSEVHDQPHVPCAGQRNIPANESAVDVCRRVQVYVHVPPAFLPLLRLQTSTLYISA